MKKYLPVWILVFLFIAQRETLARPQKISYQSQVPAAVGRLTPPKVKSYFWGTFRMKSKGPLYGIRLYDFNWRQNVKNREKGKHTILYADLFIQQGKSWKRERHCRLAYYGWIARKMQIEVALLWLDPRQEQKPIFRIRAFSYDTDGSVAGAGDEIIVVFPEGIKENYKVQVFATGYWRASDTLGQDVSYRKTDKRGLLQIVTDESLNEDNNPSRITTYQWKAGKFVAVSKVRSR